MRRSLLLTLVFLAACRDAPRPPAHQDPRGSLVIERRGGDKLLESPVRIMACARDTTVAIAAVSDAWAVALSIRILLPLDTPRTFPIRNQLDLLRTGMVGMRSLNDSLHGWSADRGDIRVDSGATFSGSFEAVLRHDTSTMAITGRFSVPIPADRCP